MIFSFSGVDGTKRLVIVFLKLNGPIVDTTVSSKSLNVTDLESGNPYAVESFTRKTLVLFVIELSVESLAREIRLIPSIDVDYYETELLPPAYNINKDIKSGKEKLIEKINLIPKTEDFESTDPNSPEIHYYAPGATLFTDIGDGNIVVSMRRDAMNSELATLKNSSEEHIRRVDEER